MPRGSQPGALMLTLAFIGAAIATASGDDAALAQPVPPDVLAVPAPVAVSLDPTTTALVAIDFLRSTCAPNPACIGTLPNMAAALDAARAARATVLYSVHPAPDNIILADIAPRTGEPVFTAVPGDKFYNSDLDSLLKQAGATTVVLAGVSSNSGVMYTAAAAVQRGYTVVVPQDAIAATTDLATSYALWQLLHGPGANPQNTPLQPNAITLSRTDLISYH